MKKLSFILLVLVSALAVNAQTHKTQNIIIVTLDGLRWQEFYRGADSTLIGSKFTNDTTAIKKWYGASTAQKRRELLLPFIWSEVAAKGQLYGDRDMGNKDEVANPYHFSYPGYNEIFTGFPDARMNTNDPITNPNMNVLEYLNKQTAFKNRIAVFSSWERFPQILNAPRSGLLINSGYMNFNNPDANAKIKYLNDLQHEAPHYLGDSTRLDFLTFEFGKQYMIQYKPRVLYIAFDETDDMAHAGNYDFYLSRAHQEDGFIKQLWDLIQSDKQYKNQTTLVITCDHGRGDVPLENWRDHGKDTPNSEQTWFAVMGPDTHASGIIKTPTTTYHKQFAQTIANLLGFDFKAAAGHEAGDAIKSVTN